eukprot:CAMPEP_0184446070 /NCGR_PEP_ID=MMETSP0740-20130409/2653_1 /TAXON_ID=385413 /ORGANISM="Thalassiosira miniscula, Strain CCMP1093" /LENGTH=103 /DNA_ID=CAMNT_0026815317 /DNA_START=269 /DNA_END=577 /DNA_ORIENTATION=+
MTTTLFSLARSPTVTPWEMVDDLVWTFSPMEQFGKTMELNLVESFEFLGTRAEECAGSSLSVWELIALHPYSSEGNVHARRVRVDASRDNTWADTAKECLLLG